ncbi:hypothetical protein GCM10018980_61960 [Streptomyces capoamus]|uniref:Uncharacterized protein n=1 Tax=Streptomyces capoamus TaxID=68183 RepID=A0A919KF08_9ACTN|nr:hypothetical protein GCM10010501_46180 [Streptomyces libani subsp. rufus]GHG68385.1 hypothetical protein GCM10018980_61960 [Streptomyces capoamus]
MQKSTGPVPSPPSRVSAAMEGLCAAVPRNNEVTLPAKGTSVQVARAGEHGPPFDTEETAVVFNSPGV